MRRSKVELIFDKWKAELVDKDRSRSAVANNFDELFSEWKRSRVKFDDAYALLDAAIKAHYPSDTVAKNVYKRLKRTAGIPKGEDEFITEWKNNISATAKQVFYSLYDIEGTKPKEEVKYGSMSSQEYRKQRKYVEAHPLLDWTKIKLEPIEENVDFDDIMPDINDDIDVDLGDL